MASFIHPTSSNAALAESVAPDLRMSQAHIVEIFSSIQGEGPHIGRRHIFVRFFACNLRCNYCDTPESLTGNPIARLEMEAGKGHFQLRDNPLSEESVMAAIARLATKPHDAVSLTGGEPLLQKDFLNFLCPQIHSLGLQTFLETNGTLPRHLAATIDCIDIISMDIKLPETLKDNRSWFEEHREFLKVALQTEVYVKLVLPAHPNWESVEDAARMVASVDGSILFVIQPVTPFGLVTEAPTSGTIIRAFETVRRHLKNTRVIPQAHKLMRLL